MMLAQICVLLMLLGAAQVGIRRMFSWVVDLADWVLLCAFVWFTVKLYSALFQRELDFGLGYFQEELFLVTLGIYVAHVIVNWIDSRLRGKPSDFERARQWLYKVRAELG